MLNPDSWLEKAKALPEGGRARTSHDCGPGRVLVIEHKEDGWRAHCFRCSTQEGEGWVAKPAPTLGERIERQRRIQAAGAAAKSRGYLTMPEGVADPQEWPTPARAWLYKAGMSNEDIKQFGAVWSPDMERVILPLYRDGRLTYWQGRNYGVVDDYNPKYLNPPVDRDKLLYQGASEWPTGPLVITEDILSAWKVQKAGFEAWSIMGTSLSEANLVLILKTNQPVVLWLDPDEAGQRGMRKMIRTLRAYGVDTCRVDSERDPKLLSRYDIRRLLYGTGRYASPDTEEAGTLWIVDPGSSETRP
ncbi:DNA primase [Burkholderia phage JG068]|uniref:DNA primase n=1 Tax=Burkholderia phage JG068 TaxID=1401297 RepID=U3PFN5_9CAUD|nr:DNA primase [Burkholderia phage JG068]AGW43594.1 DNA primase [Burkholderia phage JG068]